jgi:hypothetical protein
VKPRQPNEVKTREGGDFTFPNWIFVTVEHGTAHEAEIKLVARRPDYRRDVGLLQAKFECLLGEESVAKFGKTPFGRFAINSSLFAKSALNLSAFAGFSFRSGARMSLSPRIP